MQSAPGAGAPAGRQRSGVKIAGLGGIHIDNGFRDGAAPGGNLGDLRTATILDANNNVLDTTYYRYWPTTNGFDGLK